MPAVGHQLFIVSLIPEPASCKEFYDLVWSNPMTKLAKDFGLSDVALLKLYRRHQIPTPPLVAMSIGSLSLW